MTLATRCICLLRCIKQKIWSMNLKQCWDPWKFEGGTKTQTREMNCEVGKYIQFSMYGMYNCITGHTVPCVTKAGKPLIESRRLKRKTYRSDQTERVLTFGNPKPADFRQPGRCSTRSLDNPRWCAISINQFHLQNWSWHQFIFNFLRCLISPELSVSSAFDAEPQRNTKPHFQRRRSDKVYGRHVFGI